MNPIETIGPMLAAWWINRKGRDKTPVKEWRAKQEDAEMKEFRERQEQGRAAARGGGREGWDYTWVHRNIKDFLYDPSVQFYHILPHSNIFNQSCFLKKVTCHNLGK